VKLKDRLVERIRSDGPIGFDAFMDAALYQPEGGYFTAGPLRSVKAGDFLTSPEVSPMFGETLAVFVDGERRRLGDPPRFTLVEAGAGSGTLLAPLLAAVDGRVEAWAVEASPAARRSLEPVVPGRAVDSLEQLAPSFPGVVIANEMLDNLPSAMAVRTPTGWDEWLVGETDGVLALMTAPARLEVASWADRFAGPVTTGSIVEVQRAAGAWLESALRLLEAGSVLVIDYGDTAEGLLPRRVQGTIRTYRAHHLGPDPLDEPGATDITADVNFTALVAVAEEAGAAVEIHRQDDFLSGLGLRTRLSELRHQELELARSDDAVARLRVRSRRTEAETLLHPRGLGDFKVMVARVGNQPAGPGVPWT
jgi:SAM-dependent MidA family methyltransferase